MNKLLIILLILFSCSKSDDSIEVIECVCTKTVYKNHFEVVCNPVCSIIHTLDFQYTEPALCQDETHPQDCLDLGGGLCFKITCE